MGLKGLIRIELKQHGSARSTVPDMLDFLHHCRVKQPSRELLTRFFTDRILSKDLCKAATAAKTFETQHEKHALHLFDGHQTRQRTSTRACCSCTALVQRIRSCVAKGCLPIQSLLLA